MSATMKFEATFPDLPRYDEKTVIAETLRHAADLIEQGYLSGGRCDARWSLTQQYPEAET